MAEKAKQEKQESKSSEPRAYLVYQHEGKGLALLGQAEARTSKEARRLVAQAKLTPSQLAEGVPLVAITLNAVNSGSGVAKVQVVQKWDD